ncbi:hypothetical protein EJB05_30698, partial [Eragrostis curvula]
KKRRGKGHRVAVSAPPPPPTRGRACTDAGDSRSRCADADALRQVLFVATLRSLPIFAAAVSRLTAADADVVVCRLAAAAEDATVSRLIDTAARLLHSVFSFTSFAMGDGVIGPSNANSIKSRKRMYEDSNASGSSGTETMLRRMELNPGWHSGIERVLQAITEKAIAEIVPIDISALLQSRQSDQVELQLGQIFIQLRHLKLVLHGQHLKLPEEEDQMLAQITVLMMIKSQLEFS